MKIIEFINKYKTIKILTLIVTLILCEKYYDTNMPAFWAWLILSLNILLDTTGNKITFSLQVTNVKEEEIDKEDDVVHK